MIKLGVHDHDEDYVCNYVAVCEIMKLKTVVCGAVFLRNAFPRHRFSFRRVRVGFSRSSWYEDFMLNTNQCFYIWKEVVFCLSQ